MREGWTYKKLGEVAVKISDGSHNPPKGVDYSPYPMLSSKNVFFDYYNYDDPRYLSKEAFEEENKRTDISEGDVLLTIVGTVGRTCCVKSPFIPFTLQRSVAVLKPKKENIASRFLMYALHSLSELWNKEAKGVAQKGVYLKQLASIPIPVPPLSEQQRIVSELDLLSSIIEKKKVQLKEYDQLAQSIFYDMFGDPVTNEKGWEMVVFSNVCETVTDFVAAGSFADLRKNVEYNDAPDYAQLIRTVDLKNGFLKKAFVYVNKHAFDYLWRVNLDRDAIILPNVGVNCGEVYYIKPSMLPYKYNVLGPNAILVRSNHENHIYLSYYFRSPYFLSQIEKITNAVGQPKFNKTELKKLLVCLPPLSLQQSFASKIETIESQKAFIRQSITEAETLFNSRMDYYFN